MLDVYLHGAPVGSITQTEGGLLAFQYRERALDEPETYRLSVRLPVRPDPYGHDAAMAFFENLLPEGEGRDLIAQARQFSAGDVPGLLGMVGGECAGAVSLWPTGVVPPAEPAYRLLSEAEVAALFGREYGAAATDMIVAQRLSMSGVQQKMVFRRRDDRLELPLHGSPSNVIVKRAKSMYPGLVLNELACMRLLRACGFQGAESQAIGGERLLFESRRYDREEDEGGALRRLHQEDLCQATGHRSAQKYQARGGPGYGEIAVVIRRHSVDPLRDLETVARWALFNVLVGNNDAHAKNLSLLYSPEGLRLAPIYDVVSTEAYPQIDRHFALDLGGQKTAEGLHPVALDKFARSLGMRGPAVARFGHDLVERARGELDAVLNGVAAAHGHGPVLDQLRDLVMRRAELMAAWLQSADRRGGR